MKKIIIIVLTFLLLITPIKTNAVSISARAAVVINGENGEIIYEKNANSRMPMASTTKIMTGLILCEYGNFQKEITVTKEMLQVEGSSMGLLPGDKVTLHDLLYGLMLASGNDAANVIATVIGGSVDGFVEIMNNRAKAMGLKNTSFATPSGLDADTHYTTAYELAVITKNAMQNEHFAEAVATKKATLNYGNPPYRRSLTNHNKLLNMLNGTVGVKTGFTKKSGRCLVSAVKRDGKFVISVTLNAPSDWSDHRALSEYGISQINSVKYEPENDKCRISVVGGNEEYIDIKLNSFYVNSVDVSGVEFKVNVPKFLYAPIKSGDVVGSIVYTKDEKVIGEKKLTATKDIDERFDDISVLDELILKLSMIIDEF